ncbi:hypothetical protein WN55_07104 [Dufourea novaeangliae]|uniref:DUF4789 domain-containing protein n=1 Tax=Dufourea novaeangliae TaxID=178035 RepID=A0A154P468_DUFNO|nr:hypothetical protein WN55_07104 [Dufourea novaeangliae]
MRLTVAIIIFAVSILCIHTSPTIGMNLYPKSGTIYFPDQEEYIKLSMNCPGNTILWPGNRRCYREGEQGPCNIGRVLAFDWKLLKPYCKDTGL